MTEFNSTDSNRRALRTGDGSESNAETPDRG